MAGIDAQIGFAEEGTFATYQAPDNFYEFVPPESLKRNAERVESSASRPGELVLAKNRWKEGRVGIEGDTQFELLDQGSAFLWKHSLGKITTSQPDAANAPTVYEHVAELASLDGLSLTAQIGRPAVDGTVYPFNYVGCKVASWELSVEVDGTLGLKWTLDGVDELDEADGGPLVPATFDDDAEMLIWAGGLLELGGVELDCKSMSLALERSLKSDRYFMRGDGSRVKKEQLRNGRDTPTGAATVDFEGRTLYDQFVNGETATLKGSFLGRDLGNGFRAGVVIDLATIRFDGETPNAGDGDVIEENVPFTVLHDRAAGVSPIVATITDELSA